MKRDQVKKLVGKCLEGDEQSFSQLIAPYQDSLFNFVLRYTSSSEDAQDIVQESLHRAYTSLSQYDPQYSFSTWVYNIARNICIDHYRKDARLSSVVSLETEDFSASVETAASPEEEMIHHQSYDSLIRIIEEMESPYREVAQLRFVKDFPYEEISRQLGVPLNTVRTRLHRARAILISIINSRS